MAAYLFLGGRLPLLVLVLIPRSGKSRLCIITPLVYLLPVTLSGVHYRGTVLFIRTPFTVASNSPKVGFYAPTGVMVIVALGCAGITNGVVAAASYSKLKLVVAFTA